jgi:hypothetical protein
MAPLAVRVVDWPKQIVAALAVMLVGEVTPPAQFVDRYPKFLVFIEPQPELQQFPNCK